MIRSHYLTDGVDNGSVTFKCILSGEYVLPWTIDGCKRFDLGKPEEVVTNRSNNKNESRVNE